MIFMVLSFVVDIPLVLGWKTNVSPFTWRFFSALNPFLGIGIRPRKNVRMKFWINGWIQDPGWEPRRGLKAWRKKGTPRPPSEWFGTASTGQELDRNDYED
jgi:hypothetical protein